jgi:peptidoglycan/LPS O-acetylase OafA/YrhL
VICGAVTAGGCGVDLFFPLSAYLIAPLLLKERKTTGTLDVNGFYIRRILRI